MKRLLTCLVLSTTIQLSMAQTAEDQVLEVAKQLFLAMETNDGELAASLFTDDATLQTVYTDSTGEARLSKIPASKLVEAFAQPKEQLWKEKIWNEKIHIDGDLAVLWVDYAFYLDGAFSHCGVDVFQLILKNGQWKIFGLTDTRRTSDCKEPGK